MGTELEIRERQKNCLRGLLVIKKANKDKTVLELDKEITIAVAPMNQEDIAWIEKIVGIKAIDWEDAEV